MMKYALRCLCALGIFGSSAQAADWVPLAGTGSVDQYYYDRSKITIKDDEISYWKKVVFRAPQSVNGKEAASGLLRERIDCNEHTAKLLSYLYYSPQGETLQYVANDESEPAPIIPDSIGDAFERVLCPQVWRKQEEARIKAEQKAAEAELAASRKEAAKPSAANAGAPPSPRAVIEIEPQVAPAPANAPLPAPQIIEQLY